MHQPVNSAAFLLFCSVLFTGPFESSSALAQVAQDFQDPELALIEQAVEMPDLPQPEDFFPSDGVVIKSPKPLMNGLFGTCMQRVERDGGDAVLVGQSRSIREFSRDPLGNMVEVCLIEPPESCANPGTFGMHFVVDEKYLLVRPVVLGTKARVHVYERGENSWTHVQDIMPEMLPEGAKFGRKLAAADGWLFLHGKEGVVAFQRTETGKYAFAQFIQSELDDPDERARFGRTAVVSGDRLCISSYVRKKEKGSSFECVDCYTIDDASKWTHQQRLEMPTPQPGSWFGDHMALSGDTLIVASPRWNRTVGRVHVYNWTKEENGWEHRQDLEVSPDSLSKFGTGLAFGGDRLLVLASMPKTPGSAYLFEMDDSGRFERRAMIGLVDKETRYDAFAAEAHIMNGGLCLVAANRQSSPEAGRSGVVYVYDFNDRKETVNARE
jgi:hypothetical protein